MFTICGNGFTGVFICQNLSNYTFKYVQLLNVNFNSVKQLKTIWDKRCKVLRAVSGIE